MRKKGNDQLFHIKVTYMIMIADDSHQSTVNSQQSSVNKRPAVYI